MKILVMSCDKNKDLGSPFSYCLNYNGPNHPEVIYSTETEDNPYYDTICKNYDIEHGTTRLRETVKEIDDNHILLMCDDVFIKESTDGKDIDIPSDVASVNLQIADNPNGKDLGNNLICLDDNAKYKTSVMCSVGDKQKMLDVFSIDTNPGTFERTNNGKGYKYCRLKTPILKGDGEVCGKIFGVFRGKGVRRTAAFLSNEGLEIDFDKRGYYD